VKLIHTYAQPGGLRVRRDSLDAFASWLQIEIEDALSARAAVERTWEESLRLYEARPRRQTRNIPVEGAPNIEVPIGAIAADSIYAQAVDLIQNVSPPITVRPTSRTWVEYAKDLQTFANWMAPNELQYWRPLHHTLLDDIQLGTGVLYTPHTKKVRKTRTSRVEWRGPRTFSIAPEDFVVPGGVLHDIQHCTFNAMRLWLTRGELAMYAESEGWDTEEAQPTAAVGTVRAQRERLGGTTTQQTRADLFEVFIVHASYDIDEDGQEEDLLAAWDRTSGKVLMYRYNDYVVWPYEDMVYQFRPHLFYGIGVLEMLRPFQEEATELHNHRVLNTLLANARIWAVKSGLFTDRLKIWPGKPIQVPDPKNDIAAIGMADVYPSATLAEQVTLALAERRVGMNDLNSPRPQNIMGSRTPGITALSLLQQATKRFAPAFDGMRLGVARTVRQGLYRYQERLLAGGPDADAVQGQLTRTFGAASARRITAILSDPHFDEAVTIELTASSASINREADRQNAILLANLMTTYYERVIQMSMAAANPQVPPAVKAVITKVAAAAGELADRTIRTFDQVRDPETLIVNLAEVMGSVDQGPPQGLAGLGELLGRLGLPGAAGGRGGAPLALVGGGAPGEGQESGVA
jgi:hypothetical protein